MSTQVRLRGGTTSQHSTFTGAEREVTVDTDKNTLVVHDGATAGGVPIAVASDKADLAGDATQDFSANTLNSTTIDLGDWTITQSGTDLKFAYQGTNRFSLSSSGELIVSDNVTAYGSAQMEGKMINAVFASAILALVGWNIKTTHELTLQVQKLEIILQHDAFQKQEPIDACGVSCIYCGC